jgi:hypothetical protein
MPELGPFHADDGLQYGQPVLRPVAFSDRNGPVERHDRVGYDDPSRS